jgi:hypothetical protein
MYVSRGWRAASRLRMDEFGIDADEYEKLTRRVEGWRLQALDR